MSLEARWRIRIILEMTEWWYDTFPPTQYNYYMVSFMFDRIPGNNESIIQRMEIEINEFVSKLITRINRKPNSISRRCYNPQFIVYPDLPVPKSCNNITKRGAILNNGLHFQGICAIPKKNRLNKDIIDHLNENKHFYTGNNSLINRVHVLRISEALPKVIKYVFKQFKMGIFGANDFIYLPKSASEM